jgi:microcystin-dependent protein
MGLMKIRDAQLKKEEITVARDGMASLDDRLDQRPMLIGTIVPWPASWIPVGWVPCDGSLLPIIGNETLFSILGITYGGDGTTEFGLPNLYGKIPLKQEAPAARVTTITVKTDEVTEASTLITLGKAPQEVDTVGDITVCNETMVISVLTPCTSDGSITINLDNVPYNINVVTNVEAVEEVTSLTISAAATASGNVTVTLNGTAHEIAVSYGDDTSSVALKVQTLIDTLVGYSATVSESVVTITAEAGTETDATFDGDTTGVTATVNITTQGTDEIGDNAEEVALKIQSTINALTDYTATAEDNIVTVIADNPALEPDITFSGSTTGVTASINIIKEGEASYLALNYIICTAGVIPIQP